MKKYNFHYGEPAMKKHPDFSSSKRAKDVPHLAKLQADGKGKTRITIMLDNDILGNFRAKAESEGFGVSTIASKP